MKPPDGSFEAQPNASNHFAWIRTHFALQRTLLAAVRTAVSLIGFGFTVAQFFQKMLDKAPDDLRQVGVEAPRNLGLLLIGGGVISLAIFTWQYHNSVVYLRSGEFAVLTGPNKRPLHSSSYFVALVVMFIGVVAFVSVFLRF